MALYSLITYATICRICYLFNTSIKRALMGHCITDSLCLFHYFDGICRNSSSSDLYLTLQMLCLRLPGTSDNDQLLGSEDCWRTGRGAAKHKEREILPVSSFLKSQLQPAGKQAWRQCWGVFCHLVAVPGKTALGDQQQSATQKEYSWNGWFLVQQLQNGTK